MVDPSEETVMGTIIGQVHLICPKTGEAVRLDKDCINTSNPERKCEHYRHWGTHGAKIYVSCKIAPPLNYTPIGVREVSENV